MASVNFEYLCELFLVCKVESAEVLLRMQMPKLRNLNLSNSNFIMAAKISASSEKFKKQIGLFFNLSPPVRDD